MLPLSAGCFGAKLPDHTWYWLAQVWQSFHPRLHITHHYHVQLSHTKQDCRYKPLNLYHLPTFSHQVIWQVTAAKVSGEPSCKVVPPWMKLAKMACPSFCFPTPLGMQWECKSVENSKSCFKGTTTPNI